MLKSTFRSEKRQIGNLPTRLLGPNTDLSGTQHGRLTVPLEHIYHHGVRYDSDRTILWNRGTERSPCGVLNPVEQKNRDTVRSPGPFMGPKEQMNRNPAEQRYCQGSVNHEVREGS